MKSQILSLISLLASCSFARPQARRFASNDPVTQRSKVTAFVVKDGEVAVECWEISNLLPDSAQGLKGPSVMRMANDDLEGIDILTWPEPQPFWPPPRGSMHSQSGDLSQYNNLISISTGLIDITVNGRFSRTDDDDEDDGKLIFSAENGDDWFYFEDQTNGESTQQCAKAKSDAPPLTISTRSATDTTLFQFKYKSRPKHTVLHSGRCRFAGLVSESSNNRHRLTVQDRY